jgi:hypothetical protein
MRIRITENINKFTRWFRKLSLHKSHMDFLAAILTIPMMVTIITINLLNLQNKTQTAKNPSPTPIIIQVNQKETTPQTSTISVQPTLQPQAASPE